MMTNQRGKTTTKVTTETLTPLEEKVVRMRYGLRAPDGMVLEQLGEGQPEVAEQLAEIERRALAAVGARTNPSKRKIISALRRKDR